jgi:hypothetical protein
MKYGNKMYYGIEMLNCIYKFNWNNDLTKDLCRNIMKSIKTKDILNCHSPILTCLLISEFLINIASVSVQYSSRCETVISELMEFCLNIQEANEEEFYIKFLMTQKDIKMRNSLQIAAENSFYRVLKTAEIGTIVKKMWIGRLSNNGCIIASSLYRYLDNNQKINDPFLSFDKIDMQKHYFYQLCVWTNSCYWRYLPESLSTILLIFIYNLFIYLLIKSERTINTYDKLSPQLQTLFNIYFYWVICINLNIVNVFLFRMKSKRKFGIDIWGSMDILLLFAAIALHLDFRGILNEYNYSDLNNVTILLYNQLVYPVSKIFKIDVFNFIGNYSYFFRVCILALNDVLVWGKIVTVLLTFKDMGPLLRMIYLMVILLLKHLLIFGFFITCSAAIFTSIFHEKSSQFKDFSTTIISLFGGFVNNFDTSNFQEGYYKTFGSLSIIIFVCISGVLLINLLIGMLSNVYGKLNAVVDASHRSVLISMHRKYKWDEENGYLIFLTTPLNVINFLVIPFSFFFKDKKKFNTIICRIYFSLFYFPFILFFILIYSLIILPVCYIKGIFNAIIYHLNLKIKKLVKFFKVIKWVFFGLFYLVYIYFRDIFFISKTIFNDYKTKGNVTNRIKKYIDAENVVIFLRFIHSRKNGYNYDIHSLFIDYLIFEQKIKRDTNASIEEYSFNRFGFNLEEINKISNSIYKNINSEKLDLMSKKKKFTISSKNIKKNLIIIEILENFIIEDFTNNSIIDIEKLKMLLPLSLKIDNSYIKRLLYTDINSLNKAVNKLRSKKNLFLQYTLLNKIVQTTIRFDKCIDSEILKSLRLHNDSNKNKIIIDGEDNDYENNKTIEKLDSNKNLNELLNSVGVLLEEVKNYTKNNI